MKAKHGEVEGLWIKIKKKVEGLWRQLPFLGTKNQNDKTQVHMGA